MRIRPIDLVDVYLVVLGVFIQLSRSELVAALHALGDARLENARIARAQLAE